MTPTTTPFLVAGAAMAADLPSSSSGALAGPGPGEDLNHWIARTAILVFFTLVLDQYRYITALRRAKTQKDVSRGD